MQKFKCGLCKNTATVVLTEIKRGNRVVHHRCSSCAPRIDAPAEQMMEEFIAIDGRLAAIDLATKLSAAVRSEDYASAKTIDMDLDRRKKDTALAIAKLRMS